MDWGAAREIEEREKGGSSAVSCLDACVSGGLEGDEGDASGALGLGGVGLAGNMGLGGRSAWLGCRPLLGLVLSHSYTS